MATTRLKLGPPGEAHIVGALQFVRQHQLDRGFASHLPITQQPPEVAVRGQCLHRIDFFATECDASHNEQLGCLVVVGSHRRRGGGQRRGREKQNQ